MHAAPDPLALVTPHCPLAFGLGYLSHLLIDAVNKSGTPLFYPSPPRTVFPRLEERRITVGSRAETVLLALLVLALAILLPLYQMGFTRALHALTRTTTAAISDHRTWEGRYEVWADVEGIFPLSARRVSQRYRILGIANQSMLIVLDPAADGSTRWARRRRPPSTPPASAPSAARPSPSPPGRSR